MRLYDNCFFSSLIGTFLLYYVLGVSFPSGVRGFLSIVIFLIIGVNVFFKFIVNVTKGSE